MRKFNKIEYLGSVLSIYYFFRGYSFPFKGICVAIKKNTVFIGGLFGGVKVILKIDYRRLSYIKVLNKNNNMLESGKVYIKRSKLLNEFLLK